MCTGKYSSCNRFTGIFAAEKGGLAVPCCVRRITWMGRKEASFIVFIDRLITAGWFTASWFEIMSEER
jgi:hypothetical protein